MTKLPPHDLGTHFGVAPVPKRPPVDPYIETPSIPAGLRCSESGRGFHAPYIGWVRLFFPGRFRGGEK
jgi:hypothetical protein